MSAATHPDWCDDHNATGCYVFGEHDHIGEATGSVVSAVFEQSSEATRVTVYAADFAGMPAGVQVHVFNDSDSGHYVDKDFILAPAAIDELISALAAAAAQVRAWEPTDAA